MLYPLLVSHKATPDFILILERDYKNRMRKNPSFSLRSYARFLGLPATVLSEVFRQKRSLPLNRCEAIVHRIGLNDKERKLFIESVRLSKSRLSRLANLRTVLPPVVLSQRAGDREYRILAEWEYYAVLALLDTGSFDQDGSQVAQKLGISRIRARTVLRELREAGLIRVNDHDVLEKVVGRVMSTQDIPSEALRQSHRETLKMAIERLETEPVDRRFYSSSTIPINPSRIPEAKKLMREFRQKLSALLESEPKTEVYQLAFQLFPIVKECNHSSNERK